MLNFVRQSTESYSSFGLELNEHVATFNMSQSFEVIFT